MTGLRVTITAGGTQEPLDPVRHIGNRSSGRMGYALAEVARDCGAHVALISAPTCLEPVFGVEMVPVRTAEEMHRAVLENARRSEALIMAAAVADYRPASIAEQKTKKGDEPIVLRLERTPDILACIAERPQGAKPELVVGFAAETEDLIENARQKLRRKRLDLIVANDVSAADSGFGVDTNRVTLLTPDGDVQPLPLMPKSEVAEQILHRLAELWREAHG